MKKFNKEIDMDKVREKLHDDVDMEKVKEKSKGFWKEFKDFAVKGNAVDLAIGVVIGGVFTSIVNSIVNDLIMPIIGCLTGGFDFSKLFYALDGEQYETLQEAQDAGVAILYIGNFITALVNFFIVAMIIFIVFKKILIKHDKTSAAEVVPTVPTEKECPYCKSIIHIDATKCPHCTSDLK